MNIKVNIVLFGIGKVGSALINKVLKERKSVILDKHIDFRFPVITNSTIAFFEKEGAKFSWEANFIQFGVPFKLENVLEYIKVNQLENVIAIDASNDATFPETYFDLLQNGLSVVSVNQAAAIQSQDFNKELGLAASIFGLRYDFLKLDKVSKQEAAEKLFGFLLEIAEKHKALAL